MSDSKRVLVMGGTQFNGLALVHELVRSGHDVTILNRGQTEAPLPDGITRLKADRSDPDQIRDVLSGLEFDVVQDMTAYHPEDVALMVEIFSGKIEHYIFASSTVIYEATDILPITENHPKERGDSQIEYGLHKLLCQDILEEAHENGFPATTVAFAMVYGPRNIIPDREQRMFARMELGRPVLIPGDGTTISQVGHVDDQASALEALMCKPVSFGRLYNLTGSTSQSDINYVETTADAIGQNVEMRFISSEIMERLWDGEIEFDSAASSKVKVDIRTSEEALRKQAAIRHRFRFTTVIPRLAPNIHRWNRDVMFSIDAIREDTGWEPKHTLSTMASQTYKWHQESGGREFDWSYEDQILSLIN